MATVTQVPMAATVTMQPANTVGHYASFRDDPQPSLSHWSPTLNPISSYDDTTNQFSQITPSLSPSMRPKNLAVRSPTLSPSMTPVHIMGPPTTPPMPLVASAPAASPPFNPNLSPLQQPVSRISPGLNPQMSPSLGPVMLPPPAVLVDQLPINTAFASAISLASGGPPNCIPVPTQEDPSQAQALPNPDMELSAGLAFGSPMDTTDPVASQAPSPHAVSIAFSPTQLTMLADQPVEPLSLPNPYIFPNLYPYNHNPSSQRRFITHPMYKPSKMSKPASTGRKTAKPAAQRGATGRKGSTANGEKPTRRFCHICRSPKEVSKIVSCCSGKQSHVFCAGCVHRRLKLSFEELVQRNDWLCPKCENRCPCSKCRKRTPIVQPPAIL